MTHQMTLDQAAPPRGRWPKPTSQNMKILRALLAGRKLTPMVALRDFNCMRLGARIYELQTKYGWTIRSKLVTENGKRFAEYSI